MVRRTRYSSGVLDEFKAGYPIDKDNGGYTPWGTAMVEGITRDVSSAVQNIAEASQADNFGGQLLRSAGGVLNFVGEAAEGAKEISKDPSLSTLDPIGTASNVALGTTLRGLDAFSEGLGKVGGDVVEKFGGDRRIGEFSAQFIPDLLIGRGTGTLNKATQALRWTDNFSDLATVTNVGSDVLTATKGGGGLSPTVMQIVGSATAGGKVSKLSKNEWRTEARRLHVEEGLPMKEVRKRIGSKWTDPETGGTFSIHTKNRGKDVVVINDESRRLRGQRRTQTTVINRDQVEAFAKEFNQPSSVVDDFMEFQKEGKRVIDDLIDKINNRIKAAKPGTYSENLKASLGHGKAAKRYQEGGADIVSNLDIEDHVTNIRRSNKDEISDAFNRALGRSTNVREEFMKFIDPDLGDFHKKAFRLGRHQKDKIIEYVAEGMKKDIDWQSVVSDSGKQLYSSKEEFLINEALQQFVR